MCDQALFLGFRAGPGIEAMNSVPWSSFVTLLVGGVGHLHGREGWEGGVQLEQLEFVHLGQDRGTLTLPSLALRTRISCEGERGGEG